MAISGNRKQAICYNSNMSFEKAKDKLSALQQEPLLAYWARLQEAERASLLRQIEALDSAAFRRQQALLSLPTPLSEEPFDSFLDATHKGDKALGLELIAAGKVGCLLVAGGQGTRLGVVGPKGITPISPIKQKSLFQLFAEKVAAASRQAGRPLPLAIMTSPLNHLETLSFFERHHRFGLSVEQLYFFQQSMLPFLDESGNMFLESPATIARGPDGNGSSLQGLIESGIWQKWRQNGVQYLNFILVDNPLADPYDANLVGFHALQKCEVTVKCTERRDENEKVGLLVRRAGKLSVAEYSELPESERLARLADGSLKHRLANISLFCFSASFVDSLKAALFPLHLALKPAKNIEGSISAWKFEKFIFDLLPLAKQVKALIYPREECFAPLKNSDDPPRVKKALQLQDRKTYARISGLEPSDRAFELAQEFYYPTPELLGFWHKRPLPDASYISAEI